MSTREYEGKFYIGRSYDLKSGKISDQTTLYDPDDFTTHGVVVGMTGSGKTGLCINILEEAALNGIPALIIDPKGDISNLLLHFPQLQPEDFLPWADTDLARREGKTIDQIAIETATLWKEGLAKWGLGTEQIERVRNAVQYAVYTPGSDAGFPVSILSSLNAPSLDWEQNRELLREKISSVVTALLGLVGIEADPLRSREHILLANIFEAAWSQKQDLDLNELSRQAQTPPFAKLGAFEVDQFFPARDRFELAMALNGFLASPSFQTWIEGEPLVPESFLWTADQRPRHSIFYLAHLSDRERMFFVTLLLSAVESWIRTQPGSPSLKALIYFDEVLGFLPPVKEPPSKAPILRLLKQARAFGLGLLLTTQNPIDLDYKALSNAGTWFIGRLQTDQDKARLLDGLESATAEVGGFNRKSADEIISKLEKRVFLLHNVNARAPQIFYTRWAMAYLKGPITRTQLRDLNALVGAIEEGTPSMQAAMGPTPQPAQVREEVESSLTRMAAPQGIHEFFLPNNVTVAQALKQEGRDPGRVKTLGLAYQPALIAQATARFLDRKTGLDEEASSAALVTDPDRRGFIRWEEYMRERIPFESMDDAPLPEARFADLQPPLDDAKKLAQLERDYLDYVYRSAELKLLSHPVLKMIAEPGTTKADFNSQCAEAARKARDEEIDKKRGEFQTKIKQVQMKRAREEQELSADEAEFSGRKLEEAATHVENVLGILSGSRSRRRVSSSLTKRRLTSKAKADVEESRAMIEQLKRDEEDLSRQLQEAITEIEGRWGDVASGIEEKVIKPLKKDVLIDYFGVAWVPYWQLETDGQRFELIGFQQGSGS
jgi:hypothetical protein